MIIIILIGLVAFYLLGCLLTYLRVCATLYDMNLELMKLDLAYTSYDAMIDKDIIQTATLSSWFFLISISLIAALDGIPATRLFRWNHRP